MIFICHRGKKNNQEPENFRENILKNLSLGYDCEIDVWKIENKFFIGHDKPEEEIEDKFLYNDHLWCHAKNIESLKYMISNNINTFWHQEDDYTITSKGFVWVYPGKKLIKNCIAVKPELANYSLKDLKICYAICTAEVEKYKKLIGE